MATNFNNTDQLYATRRLSQEGEEDVLTSNLLHHQERPSLSRKSRSTFETSGPKPSDAEASESGKGSIYSYDPSEAGMNFDIMN